MNKYHEEILKKIKQYAGKGTSQSGVDNYLGSGHYYYKISTPNLRIIGKQWAKNNQDIKLGDFADFLTELYKGKSFEEKLLASCILEYLPELRRQLKPDLLDIWLDHLVGWAEIDSLCYNKFSADQLLEKWEEWQKVIRKFSQDESISKKRASLVLLTVPVSKSNDKRLAGLAFEIIDKLKSEKDILITKAVSWLLRVLIKHHKNEVGKYLKDNEQTLPKIAIRETKQKF